MSMSPKCSQQRIKWLWIGAVALLAVCCLPQASFAYELRPFDSARYTELADIVCKVQVLTVRQEHIVNLNPEHIPNLPSGDTSVNVASVKVLSVIKGQCPPLLDIEFYGEPGAGRDLPRDGGGVAPFGYTQLVQGEVCLVFLHQAGARYALHSPHIGKIVVQPKVVAYDPQGTPMDKLLAEWVASAQNEKGLVQMRAAEEIGKWGQFMRVRDKLLSGSYSVKENYFGDGEVKARALLRELRSSKDIILRGLALIASMRMGAAPTMEDALSLYKTSSNTPKASNDGSSNRLPQPVLPQPMLPAQSNAVYSVIGVQHGFIGALSDSTLTTLHAADGTMVQNNGRFVRGLYGFDYIKFCQQVLPTEAVQQSEPMRAGITQIMWIMDPNEMR